MSGVTCMEINRQTTTDIIVGFRCLYLFIWLSGYLTSLPFISVDSDSNPTSNWSLCVHIGSSLVSLRTWLILPNSKTRMSSLSPFLKHTTQCPQIYIKLTPFEDNDSRKLTLKYYLLRWYSFWEMSKTMSRKYVFTC